MFAIEFLDLCGPDDTYEARERVGSLRLRLYMIAKTNFGEWTAMAR